MPKSNHYSKENKHNKVSDADADLFRSTIEKSDILDKDQVVKKNNKRNKFIDYTITNIARFGAEEKLFYNAEANRKIINKIRKGKIIVDASIDLHGMTLQEACFALTDFIYNNQHCDYLHVIHGKGYGSNSLSKLKTQTFDYLRQHPQISTFCSAPENFGGSGAVVIKLKH